MVLWCGDASRFRGGPLHERPDHGRPADRNQQVPELRPSARAQAIGLSLDGEGWAGIDALIAAAAAKGRVLDRELILAVVDGNDKKRFAISPDGARIRAVQGHSAAEVAIAYAPVEPPEQLFHGTATRFLASIRAEGLVAGSRHHVHLSPDAETATAVGRRHGQPVVLAVAAGAMHRQGFVFHRADNGVWLTKAVPPAFLGEVPEPA